MLFNQNSMGGGGYPVNNSLRFRRSAAGALTRTFGAGGNRQIWTWSAWVKRGSLGGTQRLLSYYVAGGGDQAYIRFDNDTFGASSIAGGAQQYLLVTTQVFRDPSAWYHLVVSFDSTQATASNRVKLYVNGSQITALSTANYPALNTSGYINSANNFRISGYDASNELFDGYLAEVNFVNAQALTPSSFGETNTTTGVWQPLKYSGTYGTNGFYLPFSDTSALTTASNVGLGKDFSGNGNYWVTNNISITAGVTYDAMIDSPTNTSTTVANYCTLNAATYYGASTSSNGNLRFTSIATNWMRGFGTFTVSSGKWYWEVTVNNALEQMHGVFLDTATQYYSSNSNWVGFGSDGWGYYSSNGNKYNNNVSTAYGASFTTGDIIGVALDLSAGTLVFYKNGVSQGTAYSGLSGNFVPGVSLTNISGANTCDVNFGQRPFSYTPPTGFNRLNTYNLPTPTIGATSSTLANKYMDATAYTGTGASLSVTNAGAFKPDFVWIKCSSAQPTDHALYDSIRGTTKDLASNATAAETTQAQGLTSFNSNGFTVGTLAKVNTNAATFVGWQWQAGQGTTSTNTNGSITSTVSVNTTIGFSIVTWTGTGAVATIGHGLGVTPKVIIMKNRSAVSDWPFFNSILDGSWDFLYLNLTNAKSDSANTPPTSTVFTESGNNNQGALNNNYVAYCWTDIPGFSKFGSYTGNGSTDGIFVYTGFRPRWILIKRTSAIEVWAVIDAARDTYNVSYKRLFPNAADFQNTGDPTVLDILSNGFKLRSTDTTSNGSASSYIYMAFAETPFKYALAR